MLISAEIRYIHCNISIVANSGSEKEIYFRGRETATARDLSLNATFIADESSYFCLAEQKNGEYESY